MKRILLVLLGTFCLYSLMAQSVSKEFATRLALQYMQQDVCDAAPIDYTILTKNNRIDTTGKEIILQPGFYVNAGAKFKARINNNMMSVNNCPMKLEKIENNYMPLLDKTSWTKIAYGFEPPTMGYIYEPIGDTLIGNKTHRVLKKYSIDLPDAIVYPDVTPGTSTTYFYEDIENGKVYQYSGYYKEDLLVYDFNLKIGDKLPTDSRMYADTMFRLENISTIENSGYTRKVYTFKHGTDSIVWIEGIGNYVDFTIPYALRHSESIRLLCVQKDDETVYDTGNFQGYTCESIHSIYNDLSHEDILNTHTDTPSASKILRDGHLYILRKGKVYTITGKKLK